MYLLAPFILQNLKKILRTDPELWDVPFLAPKWPICYEQFFFFSKNHCYYFHVPICPFHCAKFKKFLQRIQNYEDVPFLGPKWSKIMFFLENYQIHSHVPASPFHCARFEKNSSSGSRVMRMHNFGPKTVHFSKWESFQKICSCALFLSFMPIYMPKMKVRY